MKKLLIIITITTLAFTSCSKDTKTTDNSSDKYFQAGISRRTNQQKAPDFSLTSLDGTVVTLSQLKGKVIFLNFWASWCGPCVSEMPSVQSLYEKTKDSNIEFLIVNIGETEETASTFIKSNGYTFNTFLDPDNEVAVEYGIRSIPTTYIIDKEGIIVSGKLGSHEWDNPLIIEILEELAN